MHQSRITLKRSRLQEGSAMILIATETPRERANSSASKFWERLTRLRNSLRHSSSIASIPRNMYSSPNLRQNLNTSLFRNKMSPCLKVIFFADAFLRDEFSDSHAV